MAGASSINRTVEGFHNAIRWNAMAVRIHAVSESLTTDCICDFQMPLLRSSGKRLLVSLMSNYNTSGGAGADFRSSAHSHPIGVKIWWRKCESFGDVSFGNWLIGGDLPDGLRRAANKSPPHPRLY